MTNVRRLVFGILRFTGVPFLLRNLLQRDRITVLCYHDPTPEVFARHIAVLCRRYNVISLQDFLDARRMARVDQLPRKALIVTFDDGHKGNRRLLPILREQRIPATIFLCSAIVGTNRHYWWSACSDNRTVERMKRVGDDERMALLAEKGFDERTEWQDRQSLSWPEVDELGEIVDFQAHGRFHPVLPRCGLERARDEIAGGKAELETRCGRAVYAFAYPNGDYCDRDVELVRDAGYACAFTIDGGYNNLTTDVFRLKRMRVDDAADVSELIVKASGLWSLVEKLRGRLDGVRYPSRSNANRNQPGEATASEREPSERRAYVED